MKPLRIGTRDSELALWQANKVKDELAAKGISCELHPIKSEGDVVLDKALHQIGTVGVFTKALDDALLNNTIDLAVHSNKDLPSRLHHNLHIASVLEREDQRDVLLFRPGVEVPDFEKEKVTIATGSLRRRAQWLNRYPHHEVDGLRGNVQTRMKKLHESNWHGAIFALAGLKRLNIDLGNHLILDWMIPAPAQGTLAIVNRKADKEITAALAQINHEETAMLTSVERSFLYEMEGGCISPIGAHATLQGEQIHLKTIVLSLMGEHKVAIEVSENVAEAKNIGLAAAEEATRQGAKEIIRQIETQIEHGK